MDTLLLNLKLLSLTVFLSLKKKKKSNPAEFSCPGSDFELLKYIEWTQLKLYLRWFRVLAEG